MPDDPRPTTDLAVLLHAEWCCDGLTDDGGACKTNRNCELVAARLIAAGVRPPESDGLREALLEAADRFAMIVDMTENGGDIPTEATIGENRARASLAPRDAAPSAAPLVERLERAMDGFLTERGDYRGITPERIAREYAALAPKEAER